MVPRLMKQKTYALMSAYVMFNGAAFFILIYYLPIYFQSIDGVSAADSGVRNLPFIIAIAICTIGSGEFWTKALHHRPGANRLPGISVSVWGHYTGIMVVGSIITTIGAGLIYTLNIGSGSGKWIGKEHQVSFLAVLTLLVPQATKFWLVSAVASPSRSRSSSLKASQTQRTSRVCPPSSSSSRLSPEQCSSPWHKYFSRTSCCKRFDRTFPMSIPARLC